MARPRLVPAGTYWLTREAYGAEPKTLDNTIDVWRERPRQVDGLWVPSGRFANTEELARAIDAEHVTNMPLDLARRTFGTVPETVRECVRVEQG